MTHILVRIPKYLVRIPKYLVSCVANFLVFGLNFLVVHSLYCPVDMLDVVELVKSYLGTFARLSGAEPNATRFPSGVQRGNVSVSWANVSRVDVPREKSYTQTSLPSGSRVRSSPCADQKPANSTVAVHALDRRLESRWSLVSNPKNGSMLRRPSRNAITASSSNSTWRGYCGGGP